MSKRNILKTALVSNARVCSEIENFALNTTFNVEREDYGWDFVQNATLYGVSGGFAFLSATTSYPSLSRSSGFVRVDAGEYTEVVLKIKYKNISSYYTADKGRLYFTTNSDSIFTEEKSVQFDIVSDDVWHVYTIDMAPITKWVGFIENLKIVFSDGLAISGDEIFVEYIRIQSPSFEFCTSDCIESSSSLSLEDNFDDQSIGSDPQGWSLIDTFTGDRAVQISRDPANSVNKVAALSNISASSSGPSMLKSLPEEVGNGTCSYVFRPTAAEGIVTMYSTTLGTDEIFKLRVATDGSFQYKEGLVFRNFDEDPKVNIGEWNSVLVQLDLSNQRVQVSLNGELVGQSLQYLLPRSFKSIKIENVGTTSNTFYIDDIVIVGYEAGENSCPGIGRRGSLTGVAVPDSLIDIVSGVNDSMLVNINNYGDVRISIPDREGVSREDLRVMVAREVSMVDVGGYPFSEVSYSVSSTSYLIRSGTYGFDSIVEVNKDGDSTLAYILGFVDELGNNVGDAESGRPHAAGFKFSNTFFAHSVDLLNVVSNSSSDLKVLHDPTSSMNEIGSRFAGATSRLNTLVGTNKTYIDFYHRATDEGVIDQVDFHGVLPKIPSLKYHDTDSKVSSNEVHLQANDLDSSYNIVEGDLIVLNKTGYAGNGSYTILEVVSSAGYVVIDSPLPFELGVEVTIQTTAKLKHLRPDCTGRLSLINETSIGQEVIGELYSRFPDTYTIGVNWYVHRGDFIGVYNASNIYVGNDLNNKPQSLYLVYEGDLIGSNVQMSPPEGAGIRGIGLYGTNKHKKDRAVYDITFEEGESIEFLDLEGKSFSETREYNLASAIDSGFSMEVTVTGTHVHKVFNSLSSEIEYIPHPNIAYNVQALTDGQRYASYGFLGEFEETIDGATYFYVSGDGEFTPLDPSDSDAIEFPISGNLLHEEILEYYMDNIEFDMTWNVPKDIHKFRVFLKEYPSIDNYSLEWLKDPRSEFDGTRKGYERVGFGNSSEFDKVALDKLRLESENISESKEFEKHFQTVFDAQIDVSNVEAGYTAVTYQRNPYTVLDKEFDAVSTTAMRWHVGAHRSTKLAEIELLSKTESSATLIESVELFFSIDGVLFQRAVSQSLSEEKVRFKLGLPVRAVRLVVSPGTTLGISNITGTSADSTVRYQDPNSQSSVSAVDININKGAVSPATKLLIKNGDCFASSASLSVDTEELSDSIILKSSLNTEEEVLNPEIGPKGILLLDDDFKLRVTDNVAINVQHYGLKNLAAGARFYEATRYETESDYFRSGLTFNKWLPSLFSNFPQNSPGDVFTAGGIIDYGTALPGFNMESGTFPSEEPASPSPTTTIEAYIYSEWNVLGSCAAMVEGSIDPRGTNANPRAIVVGIIDGTGRKLYVEKAVTQWSDQGPQPDKYYSRYNIVDSSLGLIASFESFRATGGGDPFGTPDEGVPFYLRVSRDTSIGNEDIKFSYIDSVNGSNELEWDGSQFFEYDAGDALVAPVKMFVGHKWAIRAYEPGGSDGLTIGVTPHGKVLSFNFSGVTDYSSSHVEFGPAQLAGSNGEIIKDNRQSVILSDSARAIAVDLGNTYSLDILQNYTISGREMWDANLSELSSSQVDNPDNVQWGNTSINNVRWILFKTDPVPEETVSGLKYLDTLRIYPDITQVAPYRLDNSEWVSLPKLLTDGDSSTALTQLEHPVIALNLGERFNIREYTLLDRRGQEFAGRPSFEGWDLDTYHTQSSDTTEDPKIVGWDQWSEHSAGLKNPKTSKWHCFKNTEFNVLSGLSNPNFAATFEVSTFGTSTSGDGEFKDLVDFTEYSEWFSTPYVEVDNLAAIAVEDRETVGLLYDTSSTKLNGGVEGDKWLVFDDNTDNNLVLEGGNYHVWRVFGTPSGTVDNSPVTVSGVTFPSDDSIISDQFVVLSGIEVAGFEIVVSEDSLGLPDRVTIQTLSGSDPYSDSWIEVSTENGLVEENIQISGSDELVSLFNNGEPYTWNFTEPTTISGFRVLFDDVVYGTDQVLREVALDDVKALGTASGIVPSIVSISNDISVRHNGRRSLKLVYNSGSEARSLITAGAAMVINPDEKWSIQDYLQFYMQIENADLLDLENSFIRIGKNVDTFYEWPFSSLQIDLNSVELNSYQLKFLNASDKGIPGITVNSIDRSDLESKVDLVDGPIQFMQVELKPKGVYQDDITVWLDDFSIKRENFDLPGRSANTLYLNNSELLYYPVSEFDIRKGFFEAVITPDWDRDANTTISNLETFTLFTAINNLDESFSCIYSCFNFGLMFVIGTTTLRYNLLVGELSGIEKYKPFKLSIAWDSQGEFIEVGSKSTIRVWVNDQRVMDFNTTWDMKPTQSNYFFIGSKVPDVDVALNIAEEYGSTVPGKLVPELKSITGGIEDLILSNYPRKVEFDEIKTLKDKIEVSIDGVNFFKGSDEVFPMTISNIDPGESFAVWVRTDLPKDTSNLSRKAFLRTRWQRK